MQDHSTITSMPLYVNVERINHELAELGIGEDEALTPEQLFPFDQYHYHGTDAVHAAAHLHEAGFTEITATDLSDDWATFCSARAAAWRADRTRHVRVHGEPIYTRLDTFYAVLLRLFGSGSLGGIRVVARVG